jgi:hypothetical protein
MRTERASRAGANCTIPVSRAARQTGHCGDGGTIAVTVALAVAETMGTIRLCRRIVQ